ncbi:MAG: hypothetical protein ACOC5R_04935, partial [Elusimicrobiota bacterium]
MKKKIKNTAIILIGLNFFSFSTGAIEALAEFKDASGDVNKAAQDFKEQGLFGSFIHKYGQKLFRPEGNVTRGDFILTLKEYYALTQKILNQNRRMLARIDKLSSSKVSDAELDYIFREFQKVLDPMLKNSETIREISDNIGSISVSSGGGVSEKIAARLDNEVKSIKDRVENIEKNRYNRKNNISVSEGKIKSLRDNILDIKRDFTKYKRRLEKKNKNLKQDMYKQLDSLEDSIVSSGGKATTVSGISKKETIRIKDSIKEAGDEIDKVSDVLQSEISNLKDTIDKLNKELKEQKNITSRQKKEISKLENKVTSAKKLPKGTVNLSEEEIQNLKDEIKDMKRVMRDSKSDLDKIATRKNIVSSPSVVEFPFWEKVSIGFSTLALF